MKDFHDNINEYVTRINDRLTLTENRAGQPFGADAFLLSAYASSAPETDAADLGAGTGICSLLLADRKKASHIYAVELQRELFGTAVKNVENNKLDKMITPVCSDVRMLGEKCFGSKVGTVISNPPYFIFGTGRMSEDPCRQAARYEMNGGIADFCLAASRIMMPGGRFYCVIRPDRLSDLISALRNAALEPIKMTFVHHDTTKPPSMILTEAARSPFTKVKITRPLFLYDEPKKMTADAEAIYENCSFEEFFDE